MGGSGRVRLSRDLKTYRRSWERTLDPAHRPELPAAVRIYDANAETKCVVFDLDAKKNAARGAVLRDCERLTTWLDQARCSYIVDESISGGRHVYVFLDHTLSHAELAPWIRSLRVAAVLPTLDPSPMTNISEGCIRPPGSAHRHGGYQRLVTPLREALDRRSRLTAASSWRTFQSLVPQSERSDPELDHSASDRTSAPAGMRLPLSEYFRSIATTGRHDTTRYESPSQARGAVVAHALRRGWTYQQIAEEVAAGRWAGLQSLYEKKYGRYQGTALRLDVERIRLKLDSGALQKRHTSATRPRRGAPPGLRIFIQRWHAALRIASTNGRWSTGRSYGAELVLIAVADAARRSKTMYPAFGVRHLSMGTGTCLDPSTVAKTLRLLAGEDDPFILLVESDRGMEPDVYELRIPDAYLAQIPEDGQLPEQPVGVHPAFSLLCRPSYRIYTALEEADRELTAIELSEATGTPLRSVHATLADLRQARLVGVRAGAWRLGRGTLLRFAMANGIQGKLRALITRWRQERQALRAVHGLPELRHPRSFTIHWPGVRVSANRTRPPRTATTIEQQEQVVVDTYRVNWKTSPVEAALELLVDMLGATEIGESGFDTA